HPRCPAHRGWPAVVRRGRDRGEPAPRDRPRPPVPLVVEGLLRRPGGDRAAGSARGEREQGAARAAPGRAGVRGRPPDRGGPRGGPRDHGRPVAPSGTDRHGLRPPQPLRAGRRGQRGWRARHRGHAAARLVKIYTRGGDQGQTGLSDGSRVRKDDPRVAAYGEVDELSAVIGQVRAQAGPSELDTLLADVQRDLFAIGAQLADPGATVAGRKAKAAVGAPHVERLEQAIDAREKDLPPLRAFILPGGSPLGALLHLARTVCRRGERSVVALAAAQPVDPVILSYLNRLSDLLFVLARHENQTRGVSEDVW